MQVPNPAPAAKGLAVAAARLVAIPAVCRWIENAPALGVAVLLLVMVRIIASDSPLPRERQVSLRRRAGRAPIRQR